MESIEQNSSTTKRKYSPDESQISFVDLEEESSKKFFSAQTMTTNPYPAQRPSLGNYQQTTKIIQEFNIQQSSNHHSDITVSSTINIKSTGKSGSHVGDLLSEADFQRVVQDITPADRDLFDEFLNGIKQRTDDYLFLSSFDDLPSQTHSQQRFSSHQHHPPRGSNTIHYGPNAQPTPLPTSPASHTLKQMAVQHQQRLNHHHHHHHPQQQQQQQHHFEQYQSNMYPTYPSTENQYYSSTSTSHGSDLTHPNDSNRFYFQQHPSSIGYSSGSSQMYPSSYPNVSYYPSSTSINTHPNTLHISDDYLP